MVTYSKHAPVAKNTLLIMMVQNQSHDIEYVMMQAMQLMFHNYVAMYMYTYSYDITKDNVVHIINNCMINAYNYECDNTNSING